MHILDDHLIQLAGHALMIVLELSAPTMLVALGIGFLISVFQAVTQIQEQTLTFVPKIIAVMLVIIITGGWMINTISSFANSTLTSIAQDVSR